MLEIGSVIDGKYKILSEIGRGGMSTVYLAMNEKVNKPWAIKEVRKSAIGNGNIEIKSFLTEIRLLKKLRNKGLPSIVDIIDRENNYLIVMDYIEGITLERLLHEEGAQAQEKTVDWAIQLCEVLNYLHTREPAVIYRDMKPSNIMLRSDGSVVLIDFGIAREYKKTHAADTNILGTQGYAAPEQFGGRGQTDERTDIYSLGATMYHLVTGHNPSEPPYEMYPITYWNPKLSTGLEGIIRKCTSRNPKDRYQTVEEVKHALEHYHDLDLAKLKIYRTRLCMWVMSAILTIMFLAASCGCFVAAKNLQRDEYQYNLEAAARSTAKEDCIAFYLEAIRTDCTRTEAYMQLLESFTEDGVLDEDEEKIILQLSISVDKYLEQCKVKNQGGYAKLCFRIGSIYWFYYVHEEKRQSVAVPWFESAVTYYEDMENKPMEWKRARTYVEIGNFYKKILPAQISGTDKGMYGEYWNQLMELKRLNDEEPDRELVTLRLYREIVTRTLEYAAYLQEDGVALIEIESVIGDIEKDVMRMKQGAGRTVLNEIADLERVIQGADQMLASCTSGGANQ